MFPTEVLTQLSTGDLSKFGGVFGITILFVIVMIKFRVVRLIAVDQATELVRTRWGKAQYHHIGERKSRLVRLKAGRHLVIRGIHDGWPISMAEMVTTLLDEELSIAGRGYRLKRVTVGYRVMATDDEAGDKAILLYFLKIQQSNRDDQISEGLLQKIQSIVMSSLPCVALETLHGMPVVDGNLLKECVREEFSYHGIEMTSFFMSSPTFTIAQALIESGPLVTDKNRVIAVLENDVA